MVLIGIGIPLVLYFFQNKEGYLILRRNVYEEIILEGINGLPELTPLQKERFYEWYEEILKKYGSKPGKQKKEEEERKKGRSFEYQPGYILVRKGVFIPYRIPLGLGIIVALVGIGLVLFSFIPIEGTPREKEE